MTEYVYEVHLYNKDRDEARTIYIVKPIAPKRGMDVSLIVSTLTTDKGVIEPILGRVWNLGEEIIDLAEEVINYDK